MASKSSSILINQYISNQRELINLDYQLQEKEKQKIKISNIDLVFFPKSLQGVKTKWETEIPVPRNLISPDYLIFPDPSYINHSDKVKVDFLDCEKDPIEGKIEKIKDNQLTATFHLDWEEESIRHMCSVTFLPNDSIFKAKLNALKKISYLNVHLQNILCGIYPKKQLISNIDLFLPSGYDFNESQKRAIRMAISNPFSIIYGASGTGKTYTIGAIAAQILRQESDKKILICGSTNASINNLLDIVGNMLHIADFKVYCPSREIQEFTSEKNEKFIAWNKTDSPQNKRYNELHDKIEKNEKEEMEMQRLEYELKKKIIQQSNVIISKLDSIGQKLIATNINEISALVVDDANLSIESSMIIPLSIRPDRLILVGDYKQIGRQPFYEELKQKGYYISLFERVLKDKTCLINSVMLNTQYRMHPDISLISNHLFYDDELVDGVRKEDIHISENFVDMYKIEKNVNFFNFESKEEKNGMSYINQGEIDQVFELVNALINSGIDHSQIGIISPYTSQAYLISEKLQSNHINVEISNIGLFQSSQKDYVIICTTRNRTNIGFLSDNRRINTAITRARCFIAILGNAKTLMQSVSWNYIIKYTKEIKSYYENFPIYIKEQNSDTNDEPIRREIFSLENFFEVYEAKNKKTNEIFLEHIFYISFDYYSPEERAKISKSLNDILQINHPAIVKSYKFSENDFDHENRPTILTEFTSKVTLKDIILQKNLTFNNDKWDATKKLINIYGIASGMSYLHSKNILHYDLTPSNINEDSNLYPKIKNIGLKEFFKDLNSILKRKYLSKYLAPECYIDNKYTKESEVYSFGLIIYQIITNKMLFKDTNIITYIDNIINENYLIDQEEVPTIHQILIKNCLSKDPTKRPTFENIVFELENNPEFITKEVNKKEFDEYKRNIKIIVNNKENLENNESKNINRNTNGNKSNNNDNGSSDNEDGKKVDNDDKKDGNNSNDKDISSDDNNSKKADNDDKKDGNNNNNDKDISSDDNNNDNNGGSSSDDGNSDNNNSNSNDDINVEEEEEYNEFVDEENEDSAFIIERKDVNFLNDEQVDSITKYKKGKTIGYGSSCNIAKSILKDDKTKKYAAKIFLLPSKSKKIKDKEEEINQIKCNIIFEIKCQSQYLHPSIPNFYVFCPTKKNPIMMLEFIKNGSIEQIIKERKLSDTLKMINIYGIASIMKYLHSRKIIHRDLKPANILLDDNFYPKLIDFGISIYASLWNTFHNKENEPVGTSPYMAPEIWTDCEYSNASDVYAFGILVYELMTDTLIYRDKSDPAIMHLVAYKKKSLPKANIPKFYNDLINSCVDADPKNRPTFELIVDLFDKKFSNNSDLDKYKKSLI